MMDWIFAWCFTLAVYLILPETTLTRFETLVALSWFMFAGLYIYHLIEKEYNKRRNRKNVSRKNNSQKGVA